MGAKAPIRRACTLLAVTLRAHTPHTALGPEQRRPPPSATTITTTATTPTQASEVRMFALWQPSAGHRDRLRLLPPLLLVRVVYAPPATMPRL